MTYFGEAHSPRKPMTDAEREAYLAKFRPTDEGEMVVDVRTAVDEFGRARFVAHRLGANGVTGEMRAHRVQVFHSKLDAFITEAIDPQITRVRVVGPDGNETNYRGCQEHGVQSI